MTKTLKILVSDGEVSYVELRQKTSLFYYLYVQDSRGLSDIYLIGQKLGWSVTTKVYTHLEVVEEVND